MDNTEPIGPEKLEELREIVRDMLAYIDAPTDSVDGLEFEELIGLGEEVSIQCERKRMESEIDDPDDDPNDWEYLELIEGDITEERPFDSNNLPPGRKWCQTAAEAFNAIMNDVIAGKKPFRFRRNKKTGEIIQVMYG